MPSSKDVEYVILVGSTDAGDVFLNLTIPELEDSHEIFLSTEEAALLAAGLLEAAGRAERDEPVGEARHA